MKQLTLSSRPMPGKESAMNIRKNMPAALIAVSLITTWIYWEPLTASLRWFSNLDAIISSIHGYGALGPVALCVLFILQTFLAFIPGQALMIASGYIYGFSGGILITWVSLVLGGQIAFWLARRYGRPFAEKFIAPHVLDGWDKSGAGQGTVFYVITLVMPFFPNDAMCYVAGLGTISPRRFFAANILGRGIASLVTVFIGSFAGQIPSLIWIFVGGFVVVGIIGWIVARRYAQARP